MGDLQAPRRSTRINCGDDLHDNWCGTRAKRNANLKYEGLIEDLQESEATDLLGAHSLTRLAFDRFRKYNKPCSTLSLIRVYQHEQ
jgi:hypothetical protein